MKKTSYTPRRNRESAPPKPQRLPRDCKLQIHVTRLEKHRLQKAFEASSETSMSAYLARRLLRQKDVSLYVNGQRLLSQLTSIGSEMHRIGVNLNQLTRYVHIGRKAGLFHRDMLEQHDHLLREYQNGQQRLEKCIRSFMRRF